MEEQKTEMIKYVFIDVVCGRQKNKDGKIERVETGNKIEICVETCKSNVNVQNYLFDLFALYRGVNSTGNLYQYEYKTEAGKEQTIGYESQYLKSSCNDSRIFYGDDNDDKRANCLIKYQTKPSNELHDFIPTKGKNPGDDAKYLVGDYRRIVADVFYTLYEQFKENTEIAKITEIKFTKSGEHNSKPWTVDNSRFNGKFDDDCRIAFWVSDTDNNSGPQKLCLPIGLNNNTSKLWDNGDRFYYLVDDGKTKLEFYKNYDVRDEWKIVLFCGKNENGIPGIYYYLDGNLNYKLQKQNKNIFFNDIREKISHNSSSKLEKEEPISCDKENELPDSQDSKEWYEKLEEIASEEIYKKVSAKISDKELLHMDGNAFAFCYPSDSDECYLKINTKKDNSSKNTDYGFKLREIWCECGNGISIRVNGTDKENWRYRIGDSQDSYTLEYKNFQYIFMNGVDSRVSDALEKLSFNKKDGEPWAETVLSEFVEKKEAFKDFAIACKKEFDELSLDAKRNLKRAAIPDGEIAVWNIEDKLFEGLTADHTVARKICDEVKKWEATGKKKIPNLAIMGEPGTGKTTLVKRIAACFKKEEEKVLVLSPSDLKGAYVGQTIPRVFDHLKDASENGKILFLDEAYLLYEDQFGREALAYLLPIMTGDRKEITKKNIETQEEESYNLEKNGIPPIWMAGYEPEMRKVLSKNPGLYRRMVTLTLPTPTCSNLFDSLTSQAEKGNGKLQQYLKASEADIKAYFTWAGARETAGYFGNYAGVEKFLRTCKARELDKAKTDEDARKIINQIIDEYKKEYKAQYKAVLTDLKKPKFTVYRDVDTRLDDVKGNEPLCKQLEQIVNMLIYQEDYNQCGIQVPKGALLVGPPGTGKTFVARAVAGEFQANLVGDKQIAFISVIATELGSPEMIEALFDEAAEYDASIIFIDEIDAIGGNRFLNKQDQPLLIQLMKELDGFDARKNIFVMAATNAPESLDEALKRPGRFDQIIEISYPDEEGRKAIIEGYLGKLEWFKEEKTENTEKTAGTIAKITKGFTPAELKNLINLAAIERYTRENKSDNDSNQVNKPEDFVNVVTEKIETLRIGERKQKEKPEKFSVGENQGCSATAIHEVGHAVMSLLQKMEPFEKITILPRGNALGYVTPSTNNRLYTKKDFLNNIRVYMGGRVAEELFYGEDISTGAAQDIQMATELAESMVAKFGMSDVIGMMAVKKDKGNYLGESSEYTCSDAFRYDVENEVRNLLAKQMEIVRIELGRMKDIIQELAKEVFEKETMTGDEFKKLYDEKKKEKENGKTMHDPVEDKQE